MTGGIVQTSTDGLAGGYIRLTAIPLDGYTFKHFIVDGLVVTENPYIITDAQRYEAIFYVTIRDFLKNCVSMNISETYLIPISIQRAFDLNDDAAMMDVRTRELAMADVYMLAAISPSSYTGVQESDFYWSHKESSYSASSLDKKALIKLANDIYSKYGESRRGASITLINL